MRGIRFLLLRGLMFLVVVAFSLPATTYAFDQGRVWPTYSFLWLSSRMYHVGEVSVVANICDFKTLELAAIQSTRDQTISKMELGDITKGYNLLWKACGVSQPGDFDDILLQYEDLATWNADPLHGASTAGGITFHQSADPLSGWCGRMGTYDPCGDHYVTIHLNLNKMCGDPCNPSWVCGGPVPCGPIDPADPRCVDPASPDCPKKYNLVNLLMHELGHATGLAEHCSSYSIMNDGTLQCMGGAFQGTWYPTDWTGLFDVYHDNGKHDAKRPPNWEAVKVVSNSRTLVIDNTPTVRADVGRFGRIFVGWYNSNHRVWNMAYSDDEGQTWTVANEPAPDVHMDTLSAGMLAHNDGSTQYLSFYVTFRDYQADRTEIWRQTWSSSTQTWGAPVREHGVQWPDVIPELLYPAHSWDHSQRAIVWGKGYLKFSFIDATGAFTGLVETVPVPYRDPAGFMAFDKNGNPKVVYRVDYSNCETGTGGRTTRINGAWGPEETFVIDGMTEPDAFLFIDGEAIPRQPYSCSGVQGDYYSGSYAVGGDHYALKRVSGLTYRYRYRIGGAWLEQDVDFARLPKPIKGCPKNAYINHGLARLFFAAKSRVAGTIFCLDSGDLWFIR